MDQNKQGLTGKQKAGIAGGVATGTAGLIALIISNVVSVEGGYVNNPNDPGGETNHGVTKSVARNNGFYGRMQELTEGDASGIYASQYIVKPGYVPLVIGDFHLAEETIDSGVNAGPGRATRWFQESLNHFNRRQADYPDVAVDGRFGPGTMGAYKSLQRKRGKKLACQLMVKAMDAKQAGHYFSLGGTNSKFETFMIGWMDTRVGNIDLSKCGTIPEFK